MSTASVLILRAAGINCDEETAHAFRLAGAARVDSVHINAFIHGRRSLSEYDVLVLSGGFSYGDDLSGGKVLANEMQCKLMDDVESFIGEGKLILGICNGFQVLVKMGAAAPDETGREAAGSDRVLQRLREIRMPLGPSAQEPRQPLRLHPRHAGDHLHTGGERGRQGHARVGGRAGAAGAGRPRRAAVRQSALGGRRRTRLSLESERFGRRHCRDLRRQRTDFSASCLIRNATPIRPIIRGGPGRAAGSPTVCISSGTPCTMPAGTARYRRERVD